MEVGEIELVVGDGSNLYARIFIPKSASADNKLPLIIAQHGSQHNLEMQDMNYVELARRGYVVIAGDAFRHGHSSPGASSTPQTAWPTSAIWSSTRATTSRA